MLLNKHPTMQRTVPHNKVLSGAKCQYVPRLRNFVLNEAEKETNKIASLPETPKVFLNNQ